MAYDRIPTVAVALLSFVIVRCRVDEDDFFRPGSVK